MPERENHIEDYDGHSFLCITCENSFSDQAVLTVHKCMYSKPIFKYGSLWCSTFSGARDLKVYYKKESPKFQFNNTYHVFQI